MNGDKIKEMNWISKQNEMEYLDEQMCRCQTTSSPSPFLAWDVFILFSCCTHHGIHNPIISQHEKKKEIQLYPGAHTGG